MDNLPHIIFQMAEIKSKSIMDRDDFYGGKIKSRSIMDSLPHIIFQMAEIKSRSIMDRGETEGRGRTISR